VLSPAEVKRVAILVALLPVLAVAQVATMQVANAYVIWAEGSLRLSLFGHAIPVTWLQSLDALATFSTISLSLVFWRWWAKRRPEPNEMTKITIGSWLMVLAPLVLAPASWSVAVTGHRAGLGWAVIFEFLTNLGWVNVAPVGLSLYARCAPKPVAATIIGVFYLQVFMSNMLVGWLGGFLERMSGVNFWLMHAAITAGAALVLLTLHGPTGRALEPSAP
jgi:POT family proton-dependent oligopeptide transporter